VYPAVSRCFDPGIAPRPAPVRLRHRFKGV
jgi:hypothetical protein